MPLYIIITLVFLGTASVLFFVIYMFVPKKTLLEERAESLSSKGTTPEYALTHGPKTGWEKFLQSIGGRVPLRPEEYSSYMKVLVSAGMRGEMLPVFMGAKLFVAATLPVVFLLYGIPAEAELTVIVLSCAFLAITGYIAPSFWLSRKVKKRKLKIFQDLPDILDLMTVCVEAGLSMESAMIKISEDRQFSKSPLSLEMQAAVRETRAGKPRNEALRDMSERCMVDDLKAFAAMLIQTERLGTSLADALRIHSDTLRTKRRQIAEEAGAKTAVKLLFPLIFFLFPSMFVVLLCPALIRMTRFFAEM